VSSGLICDFSFSGSATIAGRELHVDVFLQDGRTAVLALEEIREAITLSDLFNQFFSPVTWPSDIVDLTLTESSLFYSYVAGTAILTINLPTLTLEFGPPSHFTFDGIAKEIGDAIVKNGEAVVEALWNNKPALFMFLAMFVTKEVLNTVVQDLTNSACTELADDLQTFDDN
jgi:hypothetical protein